jgi:hypothetical protein
VRGKYNKLGEGERKVRLGQDSLPNREKSHGKITESSGNYIRCFTRTLNIIRLKIQLIMIYIKLTLPKHIGPKDVIYNQ